MYVNRAIKKKYRNLLLVMMVTTVKRHSLERMNMIEKGYFINGHVFRWVY